MKHLALLFLSAMTMTASGQRPFGVDTVIACQPGEGPEALQAKARKWFATTFKDAKEVIQMDDTQTATIIGKGLSKFGAHDHMTFTVETNFKEGRARLRITEVRHRWNDPTSTLHWGPMIDSTHCYTPPDVGPAAKKAVEKQMLKNCTTYVPMVRSKLSGLTSTFAKAMMSNESDW